MFGLPKYFDNLHVGISAITGEPRIYSLKDPKKGKTDKYKNIPKEEWESAVVGWFSLFKEDTTFIQITQDWAYCIGGNMSCKENLIKHLRDIADTLEKEL